MLSHFFRIIPVLAVQSRQLPLSAATVLTLADSRFPNRHPVLSQLFRVSLDLSEGHRLNHFPVDGWAQRTLGS